MSTVSSPTEEESPSVKAQEDIEEAMLPSYLQASIEDFDELEFDLLLLNCKSADFHEIAQIFNDRIKEIDSIRGLNNIDKRKAFLFISSVLEMHFTPRNRSNPFSAMFVCYDKRSAIPSDFHNRGSIIELIAEKSTNPVIQARFSDLAWLLDPSKSHMARLAIKSYFEIVHAVQLGQLNYRFLD